MSPDPIRCPTTRPPPGALFKGPLDPWPLGGRRRRVPGAHREAARRLPHQVGPSLGGLTAARLRALGFRATVRWSTMEGRAWGAACGQLAAGRVPPRLEDLEMRQDAWFCSGLGWCSMVLVGFSWIFEGLRLVSCVRRSRTPAARARKRHCAGHRHLIASQHRAYRAALRTWKLHRASMPAGRLRT